MKTIKAWTVAIRIHTLGASLGPIILGLACAFHYQGAINPRLAIITILCTLCMQIGANLVNDFYDHEMGTDHNGRIGFIKVMQAGLLGPGHVRFGFLFVFALALIMGIALVIEAGYPILIIGIISIFFAYIYTGGPFPLSYYGLGEIVAFLFFGPVAVWGSFFIQTKSFHLFPLIIGCGPGYIAAALMAINNLRDIESDKLHNKITIASRYGHIVGRGVVLICVGLSSIVPIIAYTLTKNATLALATFSVYFFHRTWIQVAKGQLGTILNHSLIRIGQYLLIYSILFAIGLIL